MSELTGSRLELDHRYTVGDVVHRGPMATLYEARWEVFDLPVYVRMYESLVKLRLRHRDMTRIREHVEHRAGRIRGAHLPDIVDAGNEGAARPFLVMRLPAGELLTDRIAESGAVDVDETANIIRAVADALGTARAAGVTHRGATVDRVWCGDDGDAVLLGLGEVLYRDDTLAMSGAAGTELIWHLPPEAFDIDATSDDDDTSSTGRLKLVSRPTGSRDREDDPRAEVYTLACLAYHCINGHHPFFLDRVDTSAGIVSTMRDVPLELRGFDDEHPLSEVIARGMARDPAARYDDPAAFARALSEAVQTAPDDADEDEQEHNTIEVPARRVTRVQSGVGAANALWKVAAVVSTLSLGAWFGIVRMRPETIVVTSEPAGVVLEEVVGHLSEPRGATPILLRDRPSALPVTLRAVAPDGTAGEPVTFAPGDLQDLGRCRGLHVELRYPEAD